MRKTTMIFAALGLLASGTAPALADQMPPGMKDCPLTNILQSRSPSTLQGISTVRRARRADAKCPVVMMSGGI
jgi:hypothetical protein